MRKWKNSLIIILIFVCAVGLTGCTRTKIVDKLSIIHVFGFDLDDNGQVIGTALYPEYTESKSDDKIYYLEDEAASVALLRPKMTTRTSTPVELSKIRVLVFGKEFAEAGINDVVERLLLTPQIATNIHIAVSTHSAKETLTTFKKQGSLTLAEQIKQNMTGQLLPRMNLHTFLNNFYGEGVDPYVPMLTIDKNDKIQVDKVGILKDDKLKLHLDAKETFVLSIIENYRSQATYEIIMNKDSRKDVILVRAFRNKTKWDWVKNEQQLNLTLNLVWSITHHPDYLNLENPEDLETIKKVIKESAKEEIENLFKKFQENGVDPIGIGNIIRSQDKDWNEASFYEETYPTLPINIKLNLKLIHSGLQG